RLDVILKRLDVVVLLLRTNAGVSNSAPACNLIYLVQRHLKAARYIGDGPMQLFYELRVLGRNDHRLIFEPIPSHEQPTDIAGREVILKVVLDASRVV